MGLNEINLSHSIGMQLLQRVFAVYCLIAIGITGIQAWAEYDQTRSHVRSEVSNHQRLVEDSLAGSVWHLDLDQLSTLLEGIVSNDNIVGVSVYEANGALLAHYGSVAVDERGTTPLASDMGLAPASPVSYLDRPYRHSFDLLSPSAADRTPLGRVNFYSDSSVVIAQVEETLIGLVIGATLKTITLWIVFLYFGHRLLSRPLNNMVDTIRGLPLEADGTKQELDGKRTCNELQLLDTALHTMTRKLNITLAELRNANTKLSNTNTRLLRAIEQSPTVSTIFDLNGQLRYTTPSFAQLTGHERSEADRVYQQLLKADLPLDELIPQFLDGSLQHWHGEVQLTAKGGQQLWFATTLSPVRGPDQQISHLLSTSSDVTRLKQVEHSLHIKTREQLKTIKKLEDAHNQLLQSEKMASIGSLAAGVAHEINNPIGYVNSNLSSLSGYVQDLIDAIALYHQIERTHPDLFAPIANQLKSLDLDFVSEDIGSLLGESREGIDRVKTIIRSLMDFSRIEEVDWQPTDLRQGLDSTLNVVWNEIKYKAEVAREFADIPDVECMPSQLNQVFLNLMVNAAHAIPDRGQITLRTYPQNDSVVVEVEDNGSGIKPEHVDRLFDPFFTTKPVGKGTGLGLSVSYGIIKKHGGRIDVDSELGRGTRFIVTLPVRQPSEHTDSEAA
ncbi:ATP-binding protein [Motiliproteus sediminis]|uniref:ATP-binding protein n=1 Tax=Motiliproteus sediminis TaxID=1468178 RepID=UPI001AEFCAD5|nr:ATP-binding protein [Motiliproteus sediminis]